MMGLDGWMDGLDISQTINTTNKAPLAMLKIGSLFLISKVRSLFQISDVLAA